MELTGGQKKQLREALQAAFRTWNALARMIDEELGVALNTVAPEGQPMPDVVYAVIQWAQSTGRVPELLDRACAANPGNPELAALKVVFTTKGGEKVQPVNHLLETLSQQLESPRVRAKVFEFRNYFRTARNQIALLSAFKDLHDALHEIQHRLFEVIEKAISSFAREPAQSTEDLQEYQSTLSDPYIKSVLAVVEAKQAAAEEASAVLQQLEQVSEKLRLGVQQGAQQMLNAALKCLVRVLTVRPPLIDRALHQASKMLPLHELADALGVVSQELGRTGLEADKLRRFADGIESLQRLDVGLRMLIDAHFKWQDLDIELRRVEFSLERGTQELADGWPELKERGEGLARVNLDGWGAEFLDLAAKVDRCLAAGTPDVIDRFKRWRRMAAKRFFEVDKALKNQCGLLQSICAPLDSVLEYIQ
jgi:hypothetical protein